MSVRRESNWPANFDNEVWVQVKRAVTRMNAEHLGDDYDVVLETLSQQLEAAELTMPEGWLRTVADEISRGRRVDLESIEDLGGRHPHVEH